MQIFFGPESVSFDLIVSDLAPIYQKVISHLQHVDIPFRQWDNPYTVSNPVDQLIQSGKIIGVEVDRVQCETGYQEYYNFLHRIYEKNYDGRPEWLDYHESIHLCEQQGIQRHRCLRIDFREKAGLLERTFDVSWLRIATTQIKAGDIFVEWAELGKMPFDYWRNKEPSDIERIKELCKPWIKLRPLIMVALEDRDYSKVSDEFNQWWFQFHDEWCRHWNVPKWDLNDMRSRLVFGRMPAEEIDNLKALLRNKRIPRRVLP